MGDDVVDLGSGRGEIRATPGRETRLRLKRLGAVTKIAWSQESAELEEEVDLIVESVGLDGQELELVVYLYDFTGEAEPVYQASGAPTDGALRVRWAAAVPNLDVSERDASDEAEYFFVARWATGELGAEQESGLLSGPAPVTRATTTPILIGTIEPRSPEKRPISGLWLYTREAEEEGAVARYLLVDGRPCDDRADPVELPCGAPFFLYLSHRDDLLELDAERWFAPDRSGLPLLGPIRFPRMAEPEVEVDLWSQNDWVVLLGYEVDGARPERALLAEWRQDYAPGFAGELDGKDGAGYWPYPEPKWKDQQERWKGEEPIDLAYLGEAGGDPLWVGTLSALPRSRAKVLLRTGAINVGSFNEIVPGEGNVELTSFHQYDGPLVEALLRIRTGDQRAAWVDGLPDPPDACNLPGDICWQSQGQTNNCGAFSFSAAMNYWFPFTNNPEAKDGPWYAQDGRVDDTINGARTPYDITCAAKRFGMHGRDYSAESLTRERGLKLLRLWILAGVPVLVLVEEEYSVFSLHWKVCCGYDEERFLFTNSGADREITKRRREEHVDYERAPVGNDVDSCKHFWKKWRSAGGDVVDWISSVDSCTFIPVFPQHKMFEGLQAR